MGRLIHRHRSRSLWLHNPVKIGIRVILWCALCAAASALLAAVVVNRTYDTPAGVEPAKVTD